jgi:predicted PurR-regulated permease PerM
MEDIDSGFIAMSIALGVSIYGLIGIIYGPLILSMAVLLYNLGSLMNNEEEID